MVYLAMIRVMLVRLARHGWVFKHALGVLLVCG